MNLTRIKGIFVRYALIIFKGPQQLCDLFYWPLVDILMWGLTTVWIQNQTTVPNLPLILMTGLIFWQITWRGSVDISVNLLQEFWHRNLVNLFSTPLTLWEWTAGVMTVCICKLLCSIAFGAILVWVLYALNIFTIGWIFLAFAIPLLIFGWTTGFISSSAITYWGHRMDVLAWMIGFLFAPFSAVFYPVSILPHWAQIISWCLPTTYIFEGMRSVLATQSFPLYYFFVGFFLSLFYLFLSAALFKWVFEKSREKGLARLE